VTTESINAIGTSIHPVPIRGTGYSTYDLVHLLKSDGSTTALKLDKDGVLETPWFKVGFAYSNLNIFSTRCDYHIFNYDSGVDQDVVLTIWKGDALTPLFHITRWAGTDNEVTYQNLGTGDSGFVTASWLSQMKLDQSGSVTLCPPAPATTASLGMPFIPVCQGTPTGTSPMVTKTGTVGTGGGSSTTLTGVGTLFTTELSIGDTINIAAGTVRRVTAIASATSLTLSSAATLANGQSYTGPIKTGHAPMMLDPVNNRVVFFIGNGWKSAALS
jgi:hypothetical protein